MTSKNPESFQGQGPFHARINPSRPEHKPGNEQGNDAKPEFHAQTFPPGTAPIENSFYPHPIDFNIPENTYDENQYGALDMPGATSKDIYNSIDYVHGKPLQGQENRELRGVHPRKRKKERSGLEAVGASTSNSIFDKVRDTVADKPDVKKGERGYSSRREGGLAAAGAESVPPVTAESRAVRQGPHGHMVK
ncbi:hypothetical protein FLAG1_07107 [Fusarium langsethiae]|uniref:Uncharacterized protein n=1 Tax=Fusarium langsethiae TaxID=179993 RepID=A0A0N1J2M2_FUSLA|nr:hypothetical protein FLAG1_07107 [Fusarium langsethiae]GKU04585.1 unnamed protein product [Fusarium langsethiae]GKU09041.1 unnamed protein product [Fusarium langsethiae]